MSASGIKVYGPYFNKRQGRWYVDIRDESGKKTHKTYARYLMEQHLGRQLEIWETVDHINEDKTDDRIENLQVLSRVDNYKKYNRLRNPTKWYEFICPICGKEARREYWRVKQHQLIRGSDGPYCSRSCRTKAQWRKQHKIKETTL